MILDHTHIKINNGDIFTVRGFDQNEEIFAVPVYFVSKKGERFLDNLYYKKNIDEFTEKYKKKRPDLIVNTAYGKRIKIPKKEIIKEFNPFSDFSRIYGHLNKDEYKKVIDSINKYVPKKDIGFIGSNLVNFPAKDSDLDVVIRGIENFNKIKNNFPSILDDLNASCSLSKKQFNKSVKKYNELFNKKSNDFNFMIFNRWSTIHIPEKLFCKIRFTYDPYKDDIFYAPQKLKTKENELEGIVTSDDGVNFMPRHFKIKTKKKEEYTIITYFWDYSFCVSKGNEITVRGSLDEKNKIITIGDRKNHGIKFIKKPNIICKITK